MRQWIEEAIATEKNNAIEEAQIRQLTDGWVKALRAKDINGFISIYTPEIVSFDAVPPRRYVGADVYRKNWEAWFASS